MELNSKIENNEEVSKIFPYVMAYNLQTLDSNNYINDSIMKAVCQTINQKHSDVYALDPLIVSRLIDMPNYKFSNRREKAVYLEKEHVLFPVNTSKHWWILYVHLSTKEYIFLNSLGSSHQHEIKQLLKAIAFHTKTLEFVYTELFTELPSQGSNKSHCGAFAICFLLSQEAKEAMDFTIFDMDHVRERLAWVIVNGREYEMTHICIWKGKLFLNIGT